MATARAAGSRSLAWRLLLAVAIVGIGGEAAVRVTEAVTGRRFGERRAPPTIDEWLYEPHPYVGFVPRPGSRSPPGRSAQFTVNSLGFRGAEFDPVKAPRTLRIACLGGSTTWCTDATSDERTWPALLQTLLQERLPEGGPYDRVEVINAGVSGYTLMESFVSLKMRVLPLRPDLVVVYHAANDARVIGRRGFRADYTHARRTWQVPPALDPPAWARWSHLLGALVPAPSGEGQGTLHAVLYREEHERNPLTAEEAVIAPGLDVFAATLAETVALARLHGAEVVLCSFGWNVAANRSPWFETNEAVVRRLNATIRRVAQEQQTLFADLEARLEGRPDLFTDAVHFNDAGSFEVARTVATTIAGAQVLRRGVEARPARPLGPR